MTNERPRPRSLYQPLVDYLVAQPLETAAVTLTLAAIGELIGRPLPPSAGQRAWWTTAGRYGSQVGAWRAAGWRATRVRLRASPPMVTFEHTVGEGSSGGARPQTAARPVRATVRRGPRMYDALGVYLAGCTAGTVRLTLVELEALLGAALPASARTRPWWVNSTANWRARTWLEVGWRVGPLALEGVPPAVTFVRVDAGSTP